MRAHIRTGHEFPDYEVPDQDGVVAAALRNARPAPDGASPVPRRFDPKEHRFVAQLVEAGSDFRVANTRLVVISTDRQLEVNEFRDSVGADSLLSRIRSAS
jgi:hypothetical protein